MSPEQAEGKVDEIDARTDQWSLACIAWECLSGERPFAGESVPSLLFQVVHRPPPALLPKVAGLHPRVEDVLLRALAKNKNDRFADVNDFAAALEDAVIGTASVALSSVPRTVQVADTAPSTGLPRSTTLTQSAGELDDAPDAPDNTETPPPRPKWIWAMAVVAAVVLLLGAFLLLRPGPAPRPVSASSPPAAPAPPVSVPQAPAPKAEPPAPARVEPGEQEAKPEPAAAPPKTVPPTSAGSPKAKKSRRAPNKKTSEENQDIWRVE